jgi:uncharacterized RDD family membrane protein YckC
VETAEGPWEAFEATPGAPFADLVRGGRRVAWSTLRHWLHDLASELWAAAGDGTLPAELSLGHVWITTQGHAVLLDEPWPEVEVTTASIPVGDLAGQQRFLSAVAASVESTGVPLHARPVLQNLEHGKFEKLSFLTGTLRGLLDRPAAVTRAIRAGSLFMMPLYVWIAIFVGYFHDKPWTDPLRGIAALSVLVAVGAALFQLLEVPFRSTVSHFIFRLAVVNARGEPARAGRLLRRWAVAWLPLLVPLLAVALLADLGGRVAVVSSLVLLLVWGGAVVYAVVHPHRGLHDLAAGTWVVRR